MEMLRRVDVVKKEVLKRRQVGFTIQHDETRSDLLLTIHASQDGSADGGF